MDFDKLNNWLTLAANIGVLASILFLAYEINQNTVAMEATAFQNRSDSLREMFAMIAESEQLAAGFAKVGWFNGACAPDQAVLEDLEPEEQVAIHAYLRASWFRFENLYFQYTSGTLDSANFEGGTVNALANYVPWWDLFDVYQARSARDILAEFDFDMESRECLL